MKVSVVIPSYNEERYLGRCLESLDNQIDKPNEIIVIDNNSTDKTFQIAQSFGVRIIKEKKQGMIFSRNRGFDAAKYEIIARCDADTILPKDWIKRIKTSFLDKKISGLSGDFITYDFFLNSVYYSKIYKLFIKQILGHYPLDGPSMALTKTVWNKVKNIVCLNDELVHEDIDLSICINKVGGIIVYNPLFVSFYSVRRLKNKPASFLVEYPIKLVKTLRIHSLLKKSPVF